MPTKEKIIEFHTLLNRTPAPISKVEMVEAVSHGRASSTKDLTDAEIQHLIDTLREVKRDGKANRQRRRLIAMAHQLGWYMTDAKGDYVLRNGKPQLDYKHLDQWCIKHGSFGKKMNEHSTEELPVLIRNLERVVLHRANTAR